VSSDFALRQFPPEGPCPLLEALEILQGGLRDCARLEGGGLRATFHEIREPHGEQLPQRRVSCELRAAFQGEGSEPRAEILRHLTGRQFALYPGRVRFGARALQGTLQRPAHHLVSAQA
jgi:hypothetical protein